MERYILYIDESGQGSLSDHTQNLFLTGVIVEERVDAEISGYFNYIKKIYRLGNEPFHSYDLFEDQNSSSYLSLKNAQKLVLSLIEFVKIIPIKINIYYLDKKSLRNFLGMGETEDAYFEGSEESRRWLDLPYEILAAKLFFWFAKCINSKNNCRGAVVAESRRESDHAVLRAYLRCKTPSQYNSQNMKNCSEKMQKRISSIRFEEKIGFWPGLEMADLFSYVAYQSKNRKLRKKHFRERNFILLWKEIRHKLEYKKISITNGHTYKTHISPNRVRKISNKVKSVHSPIP